MRCIPSYHLSKGETSINYDIYTRKHKWVKTITKEHDCCSELHNCIICLLINQLSWIWQATTILNCNIFFCIPHHFAHNFFTLLHFDGNSTFLKHFFNFPLFFKKTLSFTTFNVSKECFDSRKNVTYNLKQLRFF